MTIEFAQETLELDWETLILEAQTDPAGPQGDGWNQLYLVIFPWIDEIATQWMRIKKISEGEEGALFDAGIEQVLRKLDKFELRSSNSLVIKRQLRAWVTKVCQRRWMDEYRRTCKAIDAYTKEEQLKQMDGAIHSRTPSERARMNAVFRRCLQKYSEPMQQAILATEAMREGMAKNARGRTGEAKAIAEYYGQTPDNVRQYRRRLRACVQAEYAKEHDQ